MRLNFRAVAIGAALLWLAAIAVRWSLALLAPGGDEKAELEKRLTSKDHRFKFAGDRLPAEAGFPIQSCPP